MVPEKLLIAALLQGSDGVLEMVQTSGLTPDNLTDGTAKSLLGYCLKAADLGSLSTAAIRALIGNDSIDTQQKTLLNNSLGQLEKMPIPEGAFTMNFFRAKKRESEMRALLQDTVDRVWKGEDIDKVVGSVKTRLEELTVGATDVEVYQYSKTVMTRDRDRLERIQNSPGLQFVDNLAYFQKYFPFGIQKQTMVAITAPTNLGKSIFLANMLRMAVLKANRQKVLYVFSENRAEEAMARVDAVLLGKPYLSLYTNHLSTEEMVALTSEEMGDIYYCRLQLDKFSAIDIREAIAKIHREHKVKIDYVFIDSPDHMTGSTDREDYYLNKTQAWIDLKVMAEDLDVGVIGTRPMDESNRVAKKKGEVQKLTANSGANGQKITRLVDAELAFHVDDLETGTANHRIMTVTKLRDGGSVDNERIRFMIINSLRFIHEDDFSKMFGSKETSVNDLFEEQ